MNGLTAKQLMATLPTENESTGVAGEVDATSAGGNPSFLAFDKAPPQPMYEVAAYADRVAYLARELGDRAQPVYLDDVDDLGDEDWFEYHLEACGVD